MYESLLFKQMNWSQSANGSHREQLDYLMQQLGHTIEEAEALSLVLGTSAHELDQPIRAVLCWSKLLLSEIDPDTPLATGLGIIVKEVDRMNEIVRGLNLLTPEEMQDERTTRRI